MFESRHGLLLFVLAFLTPVVGAATPTITTFNVPSSGRVMDEVQLTALADGGGDSRALSYRWTIVSDPTGLATLRYADQWAGFLDLWWGGASTADSLVGKTVTVQLEVSFQGATASDSSATRQGNVRIVGVNHPPVPVISGNLGTSTNRIATGRQVVVDSYSSTDPQDAGAKDPDGNPYPTPGAAWELGSRTGGSPIGEFVLYAANGPQANFRVPEMTAPMDQKIRLVLFDGLHEVETTATAYLAPGNASPPPATNVAPTATLNRSSLTVTQGQNAVLVATGVDTNSDTLAFTWLIDSGTVATQYVQVVHTNSTTWTSTLTYPTSALSVGTHTVTVKAFETSTTDHKVSPIRSANVFVVQGGGGQAGYFETNRQTCGTSNTGPQLVSISPDPQLGELLYSPGQDARVELVFQDNTQTSSPLPPGYVTGIGNVAWDVSTLTQRGITVPQPTIVGQSDATKSQTVLSFSVPSGAGSGESRVTATASDVSGCTTSVTFGLVFAGGAQNSGPVARIKYDDNGDGTATAVATNGATIQSNRAAILLDARGSEDDGGVGNLSFSWSKSGLSGATLSPTTGPLATVSVPQGSTGTVDVVLTATDSQQLSSSSTLHISFSAAGSAPTARITFDQEGDGSYTGPFDSGHLEQTLHRTIYLDGTQSEDDGGVENLSFSWAATGIDGVSIDPQSGGQQATLLVPSGVTGIVTVTLQVTDESSLSGTATLRFQYTSAGEPPTAEFLRVPDFVTAGEEFEVEAEATSNGGSGQFSYDWTATSGGDPVQVFKSEALARLVAPELAEGQQEGTIDIDLVVSEGGAESDPVAVSIPLRRPELFFAQVAVGKIDTSRRLETAVALVNNSDVAADGKLTFVNNPMGEDWTVEINGEQTSEMTVSIPAGGARQFVVKGEDVQFGWMRLSANVTLTGHLLYRVIQTGGQGGTQTVLSEVPILPVSGNKFRTVLDPGSNSDVALAIVNVGPQDAEFKLTASGDEDEVIQTKKIPLAAGEQMTKFLGELYTEYGAAYSLPLPSTFSGGTLLVEGAEPGAKFVATLIRTKDGLPLSILPVATTK